MNFTFGPDFTDSLCCPACTQLYTLPVSLCRSGHSCCAVCAASFQSCPQCRRPLEASLRNLALEHLLQGIQIPCKFPECPANVSVADLESHYADCAYSNCLKCPECFSLEDDLVSHLMAQHDYKEILMDATGGLRSFSGPQDSWVADTEWPKGIWQCGEDSIIVYAHSSAGVFHIRLYRTQLEPVRMKLSVVSADHCIQYKGIVPHVSSFSEKQAEAHFNCETGVLLRNFVKCHEDDGEVLRLWVSAQRRVNYNA